MESWSPKKPKSFEVAVSELEKLGATVTHNVALLAEERWKATTSIHRIKPKRADFPSSIAAYFETWTTNPRGILTLQDLIDHTKADPDEDYPNHNVEGFEIAASLDPDFQGLEELEATRDSSGAKVDFRLP